MSTTTRTSPTDTGPVRELLTSPWLLGFLAVFAVAAGYILTTDRSVLPQSYQEVSGYFIGIGGSVISLVILFLLARRTPPIDHRHGPSFRRPDLETAGLLAWMAVVLAVGSAFDIRTHIAFVGLDPGSQSIWDGETATSTLIWMT